MYQQVCDIWAYGGSKKDMKELTFRTPALFFCRISSSFVFLLLLWLDCHATVVSRQEQKDPPVRSVQALLQTALPAGKRQQPARAACDMAGHEVSREQHAASGPHDEGHGPPGQCLPVIGWDGSLGQRRCSECVLAFRYWIKSFERFSVGITVFTTVFVSILTDVPVESKDAQASPWSYNRQQASERERKLERLVYMLLSHTSHTDLRSPVSECPLCEKVSASTHVLPVRRHPRVRVQAQGKHKKRTFTCLLVMY